MEELQNITLKSAPLPEGGLLFSVTMVIVILALSGNSIVILSILRKEALQHSSNILLVNMALSDLLTTLSGIPSFGLRLIWPDFLPQREAFCKVWLFIYIMCTCSSLTTLQCLSLNRYLMITKPRFVFERFFSKRKTVLAVVSIWIWSAASIYLMMFACGSVENSPSMDGCYLKEGHFRSWMCLSVILVISVIACIVIMPTFFFLTLMTIRKSRIRVASQPNGGTGGSLSKEEIVITKMMVVILALFVLCWIPYSMVHFVNFRKFHSKRLNFTVAIFALLNTAVNPFIYIWFYKPIRKSIYEMIS